MNRGFLLILLTIFLGMLTVNAGYADDTTDPVDLLPLSNAIDRFRMDPPEPWEFSAEGMYSYMNGAAEIFYEYGVISGCSAEYRNNGKHLVIELFKMKDPNAAYGIYSVSNYSSAIEDQMDDRLTVKDARTGRSKNLKGDNFNLIGDIAVEFFKNDIYGRIAISEEDRFHLLAFTNRILASIPKHASRPEALLNLPRLDLIPGSERYAVGILGMNEILDIGRGDIWNLQTNPEIVAGEYRLSPGAYYTMVVIVYGQSQVASSAFSNLRKTFNNLDGYRPVAFSAAEHPNTFLVSAPDSKYMGFRQLGSRIEVFSHLRSPTQFRTVLDKDPSISVRHSR